MSSLLQKLENNEAVLLMYLADELPPEDRTEVEHMLAADAGLRAELERLREIYDDVAAALAALDRTTRLVLPESAGVRRVTREIEQWHARRLASPPAAPAVPPLRFPWWSYPLSAAAAVLIAFLVWWGNTDRQPPQNRYVAMPYNGDFSMPEVDYVAQGWAIGAAADEPEEFAATNDTSEYSILLLIDDVERPGAAPNQNDF